MVRTFRISFKPKANKRVKQKKKKNPWKPKLDKFTHCYMYNKGSQEILFCHPCDPFSIYFFLKSLLQELNRHQSVSPRSGLLSPRNSLNMYNVNKTFYIQRSSIQPRYKMSFIKKKFKSTREVYISQAKPYMVFQN